MPTPTFSTESCPHVLVVDDEELIRNLVRTILHTNGYRVTVAHSGNAAITLTPDEVQSIDLLITDVRMPGISGPELAQEFRGIRPDLPIIFISGYIGDEIVDSQENTNTEFLSKPFKLPKLLELVRNMLQESQVG